MYLFLMIIYTITAIANLIFFVKSFKGGAFSLFSLAFLINMWGSIIMISTNSNAYDLDKIQQQIECKNDK